ncbi:MICOS complex subunit mic25a-like [Lampris incognitus]|uniref:MICOS complex subunit mic25a-like n=1 Tax=Lampris incognitus TaxID=2546036 RepID=UPI0024B51D09|nr:MICOS complex subunit mic25a-like [Lampris incognitus]
MGGNGSTTRKVSFGLDEDEKVTVIQGVKLSEDVLRRMRESQGSDSESHKPPTSPKQTGPSTAELQQEIRKKFEYEQALVQEQLARLAQKEREREATAATQGLVDVSSALIIERGKTHEELAKAKMLAGQLERKERELASISAFYKEQLEMLEKKNLENYKQVSEQYNQAATKTEDHIRPCYTAPVCTELQTQVLQCYKNNSKQTLLCSSVAKQYMSCIQQAKKSLLTNHG